MLKKYLSTLILGTCLLLVLAGVASAKGLSSNIPLDSPVYTYIDKLDGLGYLPTMPTSNKPYTRMQVAGWVKSIREQISGEPELPLYAREMLKQLTKEFASELLILNGVANQDNSIMLRELKVTGAYYEGEPLLQHKTRSTYQPLVINNNGYKLADGYNLIGSVQMEARLSEAFLLSLSPRVAGDDDDTELSLESGYLKTYFGNLELQLGKDPMWWGPGERGSLSLSNNSMAKTALKLSTIEPVKFGPWFHLLGERSWSFFYSELKDNRTDIPEVGFTGFRIDLTPTPNFTMGAALNSIVGGEGHEIKLEDLWDYIVGENAWTKEDEKWNSIAGIHYRWRLPRLNGVQLYGQTYGEDQKFKVIPMPFRKAYLLGLYFPRLISDGSWDLLVEGALTNEVWYNHWCYKDGYVDDGNIIGDAMGNKADRTYLRLTRYLDDGSRVALHGECTELGKAQQYSQMVNSFWITYEKEFDNELTLTALIGTAAIDNLNFQKDQSDQYYRLSLGVRKRF